MLNLSTSVFIF